MATRLSDSRQHRSKWLECYKTATLLARSKAASCLRADGSYSDDGQAWGEVAAYFESKARGGRGFSSMSPLRQAEVASSGGVKAHQSNRAHVFSPEEARAAGASGGAAVGSDRGHMAEIGRRGGRALAARHAVSQLSTAAPEDSHVK